ncbi:MAG TPA: hypothetical protein VHZ54_12665 [Solirubrobacterales bacterium]|jgi:hypothetical protein|nr:hypothetical protein [Solirubrobacterales bacterium]
MKKRENKRTATLATILLILVVTAIAGCGSGSSTTDASAASTGGSPSEFIKPGKKATNKYAEFGHAADDAEREAASKVLTENFKARAMGNWATQCSTLTRTVVKEIEGGPESSGNGQKCAASLKQLALPLSESKPARANTLEGSIDVLMVKGIKAYALYHGTKHKDYAMPMEKEGATWKVASLNTTEIS